MKKIFICAVAAAAGAAAIAAGIIFDPAFLTAHFTQDKLINPEYIPIIRFYRVAGVAAGVLILIAAAVYAKYEKRIAPWITDNVYGEKAAGGDGAAGGAFDLFLISFVGLFFEIMMIRWVSSEFRILAFLKNMVLMSSLVGLGIGFAASRRKINYFSFFPALVAVFSIVINVGSKKLFLVINYPSGAEQHVWEATGVSASQALGLLLFYASVLFVFLFNMFLFIGPGQLTGRVMAKLPPLRAYSINVLGSLMGIAVFSAISFVSIPPVWWFVTGFAAAMWFLRKRPAWAALNLFFVAVAVVFFLQNQKLDIRWTPYYKLQTMPYIITDAEGGQHDVGYSHFVNGAGFINTLDLSGDSYPPYMQQFDQKYNLPYRIKRAKSVLIVGAGTGNNAAAALRHGAEYVDVVEIDLEIIKIGKELHPEKPYSDPRVHIHVNDARNFFKTSNRKYDMVVFGLLDSHTMFSSMSSIRLDNYVYTMESFREVKRLLKDDGVIALAFAVGRPWIGDRLYEMLTRVFGAEPLATNFGMFISGPGLDRARWEKDPVFQNPVYGAGRTIPAVDNWPYLYLKSPRVPALFIKILAIITVVCVAAILIISPETKRPLWHFFFLGAAFLLVEFKSMTEVALLFGSTWIVNSIVIAGILVMILAANWYCSRVPAPRLRAHYLFLFATLAFNYFVPVSGLLGGMDYLTRSVVSGFFLALPLLFAGIIFAASLKQTKRIDLAFGSNLLGAVFGGMMEYSSLALGIKELYIFSAALYLVSYIFRKSR